jgi:pimeloyl-ACP methyl ester carboxylesterase
MTVVRVLSAVGVLLAAAACSGASSQGSTHRSTPRVREGLANIGGYSLAYECEGAGGPTVILEAGYTASGIDTYGSTILPALATTTRVCTYDRAGDGTSDPRPVSVKPLTGATQARELQALLGAIHVSGRYVLVGHSYGGMISREFAALYPSQVVGMVLIDASSEPEIPVYDRLHAGPWLDGTVTPAPNRRIDIHATVRQLEHAPQLHALPLIVVTAGILEDRWLRTVPLLEARAQTRLANLSTNSVHILDKGVGHFIPERDPNVVVDAVDAVVTSARTGHRLASCRQIFRNEVSAECLARGGLGHQQT